jgi:hypothetical protein
MADIIDINVYETVETVTINATPNLTTINVNSVTGGGAVTSVNGLVGDVVIPTSDNNFTTVLKTKLDGIQSGAEVNINADWNATSGDAQILNKPTIPATITKTSELINDGDNGTSHFISLEDLPSNVVFFPTTVASDIIGYSKIVTSITDPSYNTTAVNVSTGAITTTNQLISSLATSTNIIVGNPGVFNITTIGNIRRISGSGTASFFFRVYKRDSSGVETLIATSDNTIPVLDSGTFIEFSATAIWNDGIFSATDRVVIKYLANRISGGSNPTYEFQFGGVKPIRTLVPIPLTVIPFLKLDDIADVAITSVADKQLLSYDIATDLWKNKSVTTADIDDSTGKRYQTENQNTFNDATSSIQTQLNNSVKTIVKDAVQKTVTGTVVTTIISSYLIPANTFVAGDTLKIDPSMFTRSGTGSMAISIYINSSASLTGAIRLAQSNTINATQLFTLFTRHYSLDGTNLRGYPNFLATLDTSPSTTAMQSTPYDLTQDKYIIFTVTPNTATDIANQESMNITN